MKSAVVERILCIFYHTYFIANNMMKSIDEEKVQVIDIRFILRENW